MDIRQLNALVAVIDHGTFSAAAKALHTVQSNVSTHIARIERELGVDLIDRSTGSLTEEGNVVVARARRIQAELEAIRLDVTALRDEVSGVVRAGVIGTTGRWLLPRLLDAVNEAHPRVRIQVVEATTTSLLPQVVAGSLDGAIVNLPIDHPDLSVEPLFEEEPMLVAPLDHPLAAYDTVEPQDLGKYPLLLNPQGVAFRDLLDADLRQHGIELKPKAEVDGMRLLASLAADGFGAAVLPATATASSGAWKRMPVRGLTPRRVGLISNRRVPPSATSRAVRSLLFEVVRIHATDQDGIHAA
ncbi:MAG: LysR family transcriptional regulator [Acidimicrobiales bacterium]